MAPDPADRTRDYIEFLLALADTWGEGVVIPTTDESLEAVSLNLQEIARRHLLACPPGAVTQLFLDKLLTSEIASKIEVEAPMTVSADSEEELESAAHGVRFPCLVKPRESYRYNRAFGIKMRRVHNLEELRDAWRQAQALGIGTLVQELIPGPETAGVNYNVYMVGGEPVAELTSRKVRLWPPDFGYPCAVVSGPVPQVIEPGRKIVRGLGIEGFANVEFKQDERDGRHKLMEVNGRPNMSGELAIRCGIDFPLMSYQHLVSGMVSTARDSVDGIYWINEASDPTALLTRWRTDGLSIREGIAPYTSRHVFASLAVSDPRPFLARARSKLLGRPSST